MSEGGKTNSIKKFPKTNLKILTTKNIKIFSGYGVNLTYDDYNLTSDKVYLEVGKFKNGQFI